MVQPSGFNAPETDAVYPLGHLIGICEINQGLLNVKHQVDILMCCALFDIVLFQPLNDKLFIYFLKNDTIVQNTLCLLFNICLLSLILMAKKSNVVTGLWGAVCKATLYKILHHFFG